MSDACCKIDAANQAERRVLRTLLAINGAMFFIEAGSGWLAESSALIADSLDMLADALVYALSLYAVGRAARDKSRAAMASGSFQSLLAVFVGVDVLQRFVLGSNPVSGAIIGVALVALVANVACMLLLMKHRHGEVHMRASWTCSTNDVMVNAGVIGAGAMVALTGSRWPDLLVGSVVAVMVLKRALSILGQARASYAEQPGA
jgi:cation diffusion facilitator family transporter